MKKKRSFTEKELKKLQNQAEEQQEKMRGGSLWRNFDFLVYILIVLMLAFGLRRFVVEPIRVDGDSMHPTLIDNELMVVEKLAYWLNAPARGDIVICFYPGYTESCVKRVVGLPGERVRVTGGRVYINDAPLAEGEYWNSTIANDMEEITVPEENVFVMGDNRNYSKDSRSDEVGPIPYAEVVGRVHYIAWPVDRIRKLDRVAY